MSVNIDQQENDSTTIWDIIIVGGGPAGLSAALYASRARLKTLILDKNPGAGALGAAEQIENYPGIRGIIKGTELLEIIRGQAVSFGAEYRQEQVFGVDFTADNRQIFTSKETFTARTVVIASGSMGRKASLKGEAEFTGRGVSYCAACDAAFYKDKNVAITGRLDAIIEEIETLSKFAQKILVISTDKLPGAFHSDLLSRLPMIEMKTGSRLTEIWGNNSVEGITLKDAGGIEERIPVNGVFLFLQGNKPIVNFLYGSLDVSEDGCLIVNHETMETSVPGVYAVGDVTCKKVRQVVMAAAEGCMAALSAEQYINKRERVSSQWSHGQ